MKDLSRRSFLLQTAATSLALGAGLGAGRGADSPRRRMTIDLVCGMVGVSANQVEAIELAARHGFESVGVDAGYLASLSDGQASDLKGSLQAKGLVFGAAGLPVDFRRDDAKFKESLKLLPPVAAALQRAGLDRISTWLTPCSGSLTYLQSFRQHATRLREVAMILKDHNVRFEIGRA